MKRWRKFIRVILAFLISLIGLLGLVFIFINLPFSHRFVANELNGIFDSSGLPIRVQSIRTVLPNRVRVQDVTISGTEGDTIIYVGELTTHYSLPALIRQKVSLHNLYLDVVQVKLESDTIHKILNIAQAFSPKKKIEKVEPDDKESSWKINIKSGQLENINFQMQDPMGGICISQEIKQLSMRGFLLSLMEYSINIKSIGMKHARGELKTTPPKAAQQSGNGDPWTFGLGKAKLTDLDFTYDQQADSLLLNLVLDDGLIITNVMDFSNKKLDLAELSFEGAGVHILKGAIPKQSGSAMEKASMEFLWDLSVENAALDHSEISMGQYARLQSSDREYSFGLTHLNLRLNHAHVNENSAGIVLKKLSFETSNGFSMESAKGKFDSDSEISSLDFSLETKYSQLHLKGNADAGLFGIIKNPIKTSTARLSIHNSKLSLKDLLYFKSDLWKVPGFMMLSKTPFQLAGKIRFDKSRFDFDEFSLSQGKNFLFETEGNDLTLFEPRELHGDLNFKLSDIDFEWLDGILKEFGVEQDFSSFSSFTLQGAVRDSAGTSRASLNLESNLGDFATAGSFNINEKSFALNTKFESLQTGEILGVKSLGSLSGTGELEGGGFDLDSVIANFSFLIDSITYQDYQYSNIQISGTQNRGLTDIKVLLADTSIQTNLSATLLRKDSTLSVDANASIFAKLNELHLMKDKFTVGADINAELSMKGSNFISQFNLDNVEISTSGDPVTLDKLKASFQTDSFQTHIRGEAEFFKADILFEESIRNFRNLKESYRKYWASLFTPAHMDTSMRISLLPEMNISGSISYHDAFDMVLPDTGISFSNLDFYLLNKRSDQSAHYSLNGKNIRYKFVEMGTVNLDLIDSSGILNLQMVADSNTFYESPANRIQINSQLENSESLTAFSLINRNNDSIYHIKLQTEVDSNLIVLKIPGRKVIMNQQTWEMDSTDFLSINRNNKEVYPRLKMHRDTSAIEIYSEHEKNKHMYFSRWEKVPFKSMVPPDMLPGYPSGSISGLFNYGFNRDSAKVLDADLHLNRVSWSDLNFEEIWLKGDFKQDSTGNYGLELMAQLDSARIQIKGARKDSTYPALNAEYTNVPISIIQPFAKDYISELEGNISGYFKLPPKSQKDGFDGSIKFYDAAVRINSLNSKFHLPDEGVEISKSKMIFDNFEILDAQRKPLNVNGHISLNKDEGISTDLEISSSNLQVMKREGNEKNNFNGDIFINSRLSLKGPLAEPVIKGKISLTRGTELYYTYMEDLSLSESAKYVNFINPSMEEEDLSSHLTEKQSRFIESSIETIVEIDPATKIHFNLDKRGYNIDLGISGGGTINFQMQNNNQFALSGEYTIMDGNADLKLIGWPNKAFEISSGGFVRWDGVLENPELKFEAMNRVRSSYTNPVDGKQREVDFNVLLKLSNRLSDLNLDFTINTNDQYLMSIINTLSPEEQMRQAITILLFETIDLPGISTSSNYMTQQVNQLVASQLNSLTKTTIQGVDISFGVDSYVQSSQAGGEQTRTSLAMDVKKKFMDDRAQIEVSGRLSDDSNQPGASDLSLNNISFEYRLDSAATKYLKVYNEHNYEDVFDGEVIKTGVGLSYRKRYWRFRDIWKRKKKNQ